MEQNLVYKGVRYVIGSETPHGREWAIYPEDTAPHFAANGHCGARGARGAFRQAVMAARAAIDSWLVSHPAPASAPPASAQCHVTESKISP